jgi:DNA-binding XRE family transcriptional regulator
MLVAVKKPRIRVDIRGQGEKLVAEILKEKYPTAEVHGDSETVSYRDTKFAKEMKSRVTPGRMLWVYRDNAGLTLDGLSAKTGIAKSHLSEMENDKRAIGVRTARKLGAALRCDYRRFL